MVHYMVVLVSMLYTILKPGACLSKKLLLQAKHCETKYVFTLSCSHYHVPLHTVLQYLVMYLTSSYHHQPYHHPALAVSLK